MSSNSASDKKDQAVSPQSQNDQAATIAAGRSPSARQIASGAAKPRDYRPADRLRDFQLGEVLNIKPANGLTPLGDDGQPIPEAGIRTRLTPLMVRLLEEGSVTAKR